jgi:hypothetical protein
MKKLLVFLLISTIAYSAIEELKEYDDVSLEISAKTTSHSVTKPTSSHTTKTPTSHTTKTTTSHTTKTTTSHTTKTTTSHTTKTTTGHTTQLKDTHKVTTSNPPKNPNTKKPDLTHVQHIIDKLKGEHPFEKIFERIKEFQKHLKKKELTKKEMQRHFSGKPLDLFQKLSKVVQNGVHWLKVNGFWEPLKAVVKNVGQVAATSLCSAFITPMVCGPAVGFAFDAFINKQIDKL